MTHHRDPAEKACVASQEPLPPVIRPCERRDTGIAPFSRPALSLAHGPSRPEPPHNCARPNPCDRRRHRRQSRSAAQSARGGRGVRRRYRDGAGTLPFRLSARGSGAQTRVSGGLPRGLRGTGALDRRRRPGGAGRPTLGRRGRQAAQRDGAARSADGSRRCGSRSICPITASSTRSACSRPVPRRDRSSFAACASAFRSARTSGVPTRSSASSKPGARFCWSGNASPYERGKLAIRQNVAVARVVESGLPLIYLNMVGGQDELAFDGGSFALNADRSLGAQLPAFRPMVARTVWERGEGGWRCVEGPREVVEEGGRSGLCGLCHGPERLRRQQPLSGRRARPVRRRRFRPCAPRWRSTRWGPTRVQAVMLPYRFTSNELLADAAACAKALGVRYDIVPIAEPVEGVEHALARPVRGQAARHHRREHPEPGARPDPDGGLQQDRRDGGDDRQQVGNVGRLRHALRRHERRLQPDQGPLQDGGLSPGAPAQPLEARRARSGPTAR